MKQQSLEGTSMSRFASSANRFAPIRRFLKIWVPPILILSSLLGAVLVLLLPPEPNPSEPKRRPAPPIDLPEPLDLAKLTWKGHRKLASLEHYITALAWSPCGGILAAGTSEGITLCNANTGDRFFEVA